MTNFGKYWISLGATYIFLLVACIGLKNVATDGMHSGFWGIGCLFGGVILGCISGIATVIYRSKRYDNAAKQDQIAVETLAALGKQRRDGKL